MHHAVQAHFHPASHDHSSQPGRDSRARPAVSRRQPIHIRAPFPSFRTRTVADVNPRASIFNHASVFSRNFFRIVAEANVRAKIPLAAYVETMHSLSCAGRIAPRTVRNMTVAKPSQAW
jgi:hypothetical protein